MKYLLSTIFMVGCVPPTENDLLADSDRFDSEIGPTLDSGDPSVGTDTASDALPAPDLNWTLDSHTNEPYAEQTAQLSVEVTGVTLSVNHSFATSVTDIDFSQSMSFSLDDMDLNVSYGHILTEGDALNTWNNLAYTVNLENLPAGEYSLSIFGDTLNTDGAMESNELDRTTFVIPAE